MSSTSLRFLGLDPGLRATGWGLIEVTGNHVSHLGHGTVRVPGGDGLADRLSALYRGLTEIIEQFKPDQAAVEEIFVNVNGKSTLLLGQARGVVMLVPSLMGVPVFEYPTNTVKKSVVGYGHADKTQVAHMVGHILPGLDLAAGDAADALAVAICHSHHASTAARVDAARGAA